jgi:hypothetical protein
MNAAVPIAACLRKSRLGIDLSDTVPSQEFRLVARALTNIFQQRSVEAGFQARRHDACSFPLTFAFSTRCVLKAKSIR